MLGSAVILVISSCLLVFGQIPKHGQDTDFVQDLAAKVAALEKADELQKLEIENQRDSLKSQRESLLKIQAENAEQRLQLLLQDQRIAELENVVHAQQRIVKDRVFGEDVAKTDVVSNSQTKPDAINSTLAEYEIGDKRRLSKVHVRRKITNGQSRSERFVAQKPEIVAFHATIDVASHVTKLTVGQTIVFDSVHLNLGGGYHSSAGLFLAPTGGIYMFSVSVMLNTVSGYISLNLMQNGAVVAETYANGYDQGSVSVVTQLNVGDEVLVKVHGPDNTLLYGEKLTSFMGVLVVPM